MGTFLVQLHWQNTKNPKETEMKMQREISSHGEMVEFVDEFVDKCPPPDGWRVLVVTEKSPLFWGVPREEQ